MKYRNKMTRYGLSALTAVLLSGVAPVAAYAQAAPDSSNALLIAILVKRGVITKSDAAEIMHQVAAEQAEAAAAPVRTAVPASIAPRATAVASTSPDGTIHVTYVPRNVQEQIATQVKQEVLATEQAQGYAAPNQIPDWVNHIHIYGDVRTRYEGDMFPSGNDNTGGLPNFNAINTGSPFDTSQANPNFPPQLNTDQNRNRFELRARLGVDADLGDGFTVGIRIATGQTNSPVSENQTLGGANSAQGGNFSKYAIWLDRGYIAYTPQLGNRLNLAFKVGRYDNPFFSTPLIWNDDIGFDGIVATGSYHFDNGLAPFFTIDASPVFNTDFNFASNQPAKFSSEDKYMFAAQAGAAYRFNKDYAAKLGVADYLFTNMAGKLSAPCLVISAADSCSTDDDRPSFAQNGNTYMALRNIIPTAANNNGATDQFQYFGLASGFNELALTGQVDVSNFDPTHIWLNGEYVRNLAFNKNDIENKAVNNRGGTADGSLGGFDGGDVGYYINASIGQPVLRRRWDWNASLGYRYIESDAVVDAFNDSDFGLGGTNLKGYTVGGNLALTPKVWVRLRYMSADSIAGPTYDSDVVQLDLNAKF
jgi:hypothetical protein